MPGIWIARLARRLTRPDTFDRLVSPAIADLQLEAQHGWWARWRHYPVLAYVVVFALFRDLLGDLARVFDAGAIGVVWSRTAAWALAAGAINGAVMYALLSNAPGTWPGDDGARLAVLGRESIGVALTVAMIVAAYKFRRREGAGPRAVAAATVVVAIVAFVATHVSTMLWAPAIHAVVEAGRTASGPATDIVVVYPPDIVNALSMIPFAWLGVVLARRRGWGLAASAAAILGTWVFVNATAFPYYQVAHIVPGLETVLFDRYSVPPHMVTLIGLIIVWRAIERCFDRLTVASAR